MLAIFCIHDYLATLSNRLCSLQDSVFEFYMFPALTSLPFLQNIDKYLVRADIPGILKSNVKLSVDGDLLTLAVEAGKDETKEEERKGIKFHRCQASSSSQEVVLLYIEYNSL